MTQPRKNAAGAARRNGGSALSESVKDAIERYFRDLDGHDAGDLYELVLGQVEVPLFEAVLQNTGGNVSQAAQLLGLNRATLRSRLKKYGID